MQSLIAILISCSALAASGQDLRASGRAWARPGLAPAQSRLMAERGAQVVAARNLVAARAGRLEPSPVRGVVRGHNFQPAERHPDGSVTVRASAPACGIRPE